MSLNFIEEMQSLFRTPVLMDCGPRQMELDRPGYEVKFGEYGHGAVYRWGGPLPRGSEPLQEIVSRLTAQIGEYAYFL